jgi:Iap family predicted aminopeptidase
MKIDERIEERAQYNPVIHAMIHSWRKSMIEGSPMSEREFLINLSLMLDTCYTILFQDLVKYHETKRVVNGIRTEEKKWVKQ